MRDPVPHVYRHKFTRLSLRLLWPWLENNGPCVPAASSRALGLWPSGQFLVKAQPRAYPPCGPGEVDVVQDPVGLVDAPEGHVSAPCPRPGIRRQAELTTHVQRVALPGPVLVHLSLPLHGVLCLGNTFVRTLYI
jgi:hypothetical protein